MKAIDFMNPAIIFLIVASANLSAWCAGFQPVVASTCGACGRFYPICIINLSNLGGASPAPTMIAKFNGAPQEGESPLDPF